MENEPNKRNDSLLQLGVSINPKTRPGTLPKVAQKTENRKPENQPESIFITGDLGPIWIGYSETRSVRNPEIIILL